MWFPRVVQSYALDCAMHWGCHTLGQILVNTGGLRPWRFRRHLSFVNALRRKIQHRLTEGMVDMVELGHVILLPGNETLHVFDEISGNCMPGFPTRLPHTTRLDIGTWRVSLS
jgi:hypothetical protein